MKFIAAVFLLITSLSAHGIDIKPSLSGSWYKPAESGHGFNVEVIDGNQTIIYWYVYDVEGEPIWLFSQGPNIGNRVEAVVYWHEGMTWDEFDHDDLNQQVWGTMTMVFHDCDNATITYSSDMSYKGQPFGSGTIEVKRLTYIANNECTENDLGGNYVLAGINPSSQAALGYGIIFEDGLAFIAGARNDSYWAITVGYFTENNGRFTFEGIEAGSTGNFNRVNTSGDYLPGRINIPVSSIGRITAVRDRYMFMTNVPLSTVAKSWSVTGALTGQFFGNIQLHTNGSVSGSTVAGCSVSGAWYYPNVNFNQIYMEFASSNCPVAGASVAAAFYDIQNDELNIVGYIFDPETFVPLDAYALVGR